MSEVNSKIIIPKRATKTKLASSGSVLKEGEIALIYPDTGPGTGAAKLVSGDGSTVAKNLPIAIDGEAIDELRNSLDIAKKIIPVTFNLAGWKSVNGDNSAPYVQTVINEELKSSMNPDLVSMLDENATPEEQEVYNKNLAIISQGVGTVNNGSITYKVYKLPSADITIGLTRLGGVKEVETASGVDDVKVGGVSVVENKVAKIPAIPKSNVIINHIALDGLQGQVNIDPVYKYDALIVIDKDTPLPPNKFIGITLGFSASENDLTTYPNIKVSMTIIDSAELTQSSNSETLILGFSIGFAFHAETGSGSEEEGTLIDTLSAASLYVNIVTDGIELSLDKTQSLVGKRGAS